MDVVKPFLDYARKFIEITEEEFRQLIYPYITVRKYGKKQIITEAGNIENYFNFIVRGLARKYYRKGKEEINTQISFEGHIMHSQESFHSRTPSEYFIEAIEHTTLVSITYDDLEKIYGAFGSPDHYVHDGHQRSLADAVSEAHTAGAIHSFCSSQSRTTAAGATKISCQLSQHQARNIQPLQTPGTSRFKK